MSVRSSCSHECSCRTRGRQWHIYGHEHNLGALLDAVLPEIGALFPVLGSRPDHHAVGGLKAGSLRCASTQECGGPVLQAKFVEAVGLML